MFMFSLIGNRARGEKWNRIPQIRRAGFCGITSACTPPHSLPSLHAYLGLSFHSLIRPFPFLVDRVVQNPGREQLQGDQFTAEAHMGCSSGMTSKVSKFIFYRQLYVYMSLRPYALGICLHHQHWAAGSMLTSISVCVSACHSVLTVRRDSHIKKKYSLRFFFLFSYFCYWKGERCGLHLCHHFIYAVLEVTSSLMYLSLSCFSFLFFISCDIANYHVTSCTCKIIYKCIYFVM